MESPRDVYRNACAEIAATLQPLGYRFAKSGPHAQRQEGDFVYRISFQSSNKNVAGQYIALWIHTTVLSKRLEDWRKEQAHPLLTNDWVAGGQIGNLVVPPRWRDWNLADISRAGVIADAIFVIKSIALPYFARFEDIPGVCALLQREGLPAMDTARAIEFLLCYADCTAAEAALNRFFQSRPELLDDYHVHFNEFRRNGLPQVRRTGFAYELAFVTVGYGLRPPLGSRN
jgi:hypothetical protein